MDARDPRSVLEETYRNESRRLYARLVRALNDFDVAEDALQDAVRSAAIQWPAQGTPENPAGWLYQAAKFRGLSMLQKKRRLVPLLDDEPIAPAEDGDDLLRLVFTCCHPAISPDAQVALTLREVCELTTEEIASAFLMPAPTIAQRIVRAKAKIRDAAIPFEVPSHDELPSRMQAVLKTIYLVFNEGYSSSHGPSLVRADLMALGIELGRQLVERVPEPEAIGLLALMMIHEARRRTRMNHAGEIILLEDQDRTQWDEVAIKEAGNLVAAALRSGRVGPYTLQAAIAAVHAEALSYAETDWNEIIGLYDLLIRLEPSPVVALNRAVAIAMRDGPAVGVAQIDDLLASGCLSGYHLAHSARGELLRRTGDVKAARESLQTALSLARQEPERQLIRRRLVEIS